MNRHQRRRGKQPPQGRDWRRQLQDIIDQHNPHHALYYKDVSFKTQDNRASFLFSFFKELRDNEEKVHKPMPRNLDNGHVKFMVGRWVRRGVAPGTLQVYLSYLRTFCEWIDKPGMILKPEHYVSDPALVERLYAAERDKSWSAQGIDTAKMIAEVKAYDPYVGCQLDLQWRFGLRVKESIMCRPLLAQLDGVLVIPDDDDLAPDQEPTHLEVKRGTKGGRLRYVPIDTPEKRAALESARALVGHKHAHLGRPGKSLEQNLERFRTVMKRFGITRAMLGITAHGLRHEYGNDRYEQYCGEPSPVRGGGRIERARDKAARLKVADELGHSREGITPAYCGKILKGKPAADSRDPSPPEGPELNPAPPDAPGAPKEGGGS